MISYSQDKKEAEHNRAERGGALIMALLLGAVAVLLGGTFLAMSLTDRRIASNEADNVGAFNCADAGVQHAVAELPDQDIDTLLTAGGNLFTNQALGDGSYSVAVENNVNPDFPTANIPADSGGATSDTDGYLVLTSTGRVGDAERSVSVIVSIGSTASSSPFAYAVWGDSEVLISGGGHVDCYDSSAGAYDAATATHDAGVFSNEVIEMSGGSYIYGDGISAGEIKRPEYITGEAITGADKQSFPVLDCPSGGYTPASDITLGDGATYKDGELTVGGGNHITLSAPPYEYYFAAVTLSGGSTMSINGGGEHVDIYVEQKFVSGGGGVVNVTQNPADLSINSCGVWAKPQRFEVSGGGSAYFTIYAPDRDIVVSGDGDLWGAFIGYTLNATGGSKIHCDKALGGGHSSGASGGGLEIVENSWNEIIY